MKIPLLLLNTPFPSTTFMTFSQHPLVLISRREHQHCCKWHQFNMLLLTAFVEFPLKNGIVVTWMKMKKAHSSTTIPTRAVPLSVSYAMSLPSSIAQTGSYLCQRIGNRFRCAQRRIWMNSTILWALGKWETIVTACQTVRRLLLRLQQQFCPYMLVCV